MLLPGLAPDRVAFWASRWSSSPRVVGSSGEPWDISEVRALVRCRDLATESDIEALSILGIFTWGDFRRDNLACWGG
jgi:hypothetical protein